MEERGIKTQAMTNPEITEKSDHLGWKKLERKREKKKTKPGILLYFMALAVQVVKFFLIIIKYWNFPESGILSLSKSSTIRQTGCEYPISETTRAKNVLFFFFNERKHSEKLLIVMLIFQSEKVSHFDSFARREFVIKSTLKWCH